ncbi:hypothetical protein A4H97_32070 [Niastella yeongjuensis]|uniref:Uncharacterized protein n=1 Tax=Niastella yeongjuensis TaxID=354355 RepID=A0A1V9EIB8_9BACT|nr:DUF6266 family protein [Niastella yeongjuensis]OQP45879.1 hypothetical protein A4H97_32070 [Niastella yeongjuensis]SEP46752.1 hypothetical protein SAMN05660816_06496 [Niastella yeongjuensis]
MTHISNNPSLGIIECNKENVHVAFAQNLVITSSNLSALHFAQREMLERLAFVLQTFIPFFIESHGHIKRIADVSYVMSHNLMTVLSFTDLEFKIDYSKLLLSQGNLPNAISPLSRAAPGGIEFCWARHNLVGTQKNDKAILVVYCEALNQCIYNIGDIRREDKGVFMETPPFSGYEVHCWLSFLSEDETEIATSVYTGPCFIP